MQATLRETGVALIGYVLFQKAQGRGFATEAVAGVLEHLAAREGATEAHASVDAANVRSVALLERLGFEHAGGELYVRTLKA